jgi:hypothetical protein
MEADLIIRYKHDVSLEKEHVCTGEMFYRPNDGSLPPHGHWEFEKTHFRQLLIEASNRLNKDDRFHIEKIVIERTDRQGLSPIVLDHPTQEVLKTDPALAVRLLSYEGRAVYGGGGVKQEQKAPPFLRSGYETLAESIGSEIYCRQRKGLVECPGCGMWSMGNNPFRCLKQCHIAGLWVTYTEQWAKFKVIDLLNLNLPKYFIPRGFNKTKPWMTNSELKELFLTWEHFARQDIELTQEKRS